MNKILFNEDRCFGCGACVNIAPDNFTYSDDGRTVMTNDTVSEAAIEASEICPASAIVIEHECNCGEECNCGDDCHCDEECSCEGCNCSK